MVVLPGAARKLNSRKFGVLANDGFMVGSRVPTADIPTVAIKLRLVIFIGVILGIILYKPSIHYPTRAVSKHDELFIVLL